MPRRRCPELTPYAPLSRCAGQGSPCCRTPGVLDAFGDAAPVLDLIRYRDKRRVQQLFLNRGLRSQHDLQASKQVLPALDLALSRPCELLAQLALRLVILKQ